MSASSLPPSTSGSSPNHPREPSRGAHPRGEKDYRPHPPGDRDHSGSARPASHHHHHSSSSQLLSSHSDYFYWACIGGAILILLVGFLVAHQLRSRSVPSASPATSTSSPASTPPAPASHSPASPASPATPSLPPPSPVSPSPTRAQIITAITPLLAKYQLTLSALSVKSCQPVVNVFATTGGRATCDIEYQVTYPDHKTATSTASVDFVMNNQSVWRALPVQEH